jgi:hypothetical protein
MSYLALPRLTFTGRFQADVSTINNIVSNYDLNNPNIEQLWNPEGTGTFRLLNCRVTGGYRADGEIGGDDPALQAVLVGADDRSSAKLVDLDPEWQLSSEIWSLELRLVTAQDADELLSGRFCVSPFRDLVRRQLLRPAPNGQPRGAAFVGALEEVAWSPLADTSDAMKELRDTTAHGSLSVVFNTFGFYYTHIDGRFATGTLVGCLGPQQPGEPKTFIAGRRLQALEVGANGQPVDLVGPSSAIVDRTGGRISVDLGNSLPIDDTDGTLTDLSTINLLQGMQALCLIVLDNDTRQPFAPLTPEDFTEVGLIPYLDAAWYPRTAGIATFLAADDLVTRAASQPLALAAKLVGGDAILLNREASGGLYYRADDFVVRLDPGGTATVTFHARRFGEPASGVQLHIELATDVTDGTPASALEFSNSIVTDDSGRATLEIKGNDPANPRGSLDGQIYTMTYGASLDGSGQPSYDGSGLDPFLDRVIVHLRDGYTVPDRPSWFGDIELILAQFGRLYPIMTKHLVDLTDYTSVVRHRRALLLAFSRPLADSNYMPVTRDLSAPKQATLVKWLQTETGDSDEPLVKGTPSGPVFAAAPAVREAAAGPPDSGKPAFERLDAFRRRRRAPGSLPTI